MQKKEKNIPVIKNECYRIEIEDLNVDGDGVGRIDGYTLFVPGSIPGDRVYVKVLKTKKNYGYGRVEEIIRPSNDRCESKCSISNKCGGCQLHHMNYSAQLTFKKRLVEQTLKRIGGFEALKVEDTIGMDEPYFYRNKVQYPVGEDMHGQIQIGFYANRSHRIVPIETCWIQNNKNDDIIKAIKEYMVANRVRSYNEEQHKGLVRHIVTRYSKAHDVFQVTLVINGTEVPNEQDLVNRLLKVDGVVSILLNKNKEKTNVILGKQFETLYGDRYITDTIGEVSYRISPSSFYQVNPEQTEKLYSTALEYTGLTGEEKVWDIYCGIGTIALYLANKAKYVYAVEIVPEAIEDAKYNMKLNHIENAEFYVGKAEEVIVEKYKEGLHAEVVVIDPPRKGCDPVLLETILKMQPERIVYVSCDPATLARDARILADGGYEVRKAQPVDMFPMTTHVETVCLFEHSKSVEKYEFRANL